MKKIANARLIWRDAGGQDITEYSLLLAFVIVIAVAIFLISGEDIQSIWTASSTTVSAASSVAGS